MGNYETIYLGVYLVCKVSITKEPIIKYECKECFSKINISQGRFCQKCGQEAFEVLKGFNTISNVNAWDVLEAVNEKLMPTMEINKPDKHYWRSNITNKGVDLKYHDFSDLELTIESKKEYMDDFFSLHSEHLKTLNEIYGEDNVEIKFGILKYGD